VLACNIGNSRRVNGTTASTHQYAVQRCEAHGGIYRLAVLYCGNGRTIAQMTGNHLQILQILAHNFCQLGSDKAVRSAVEAILTNMELLVILIREAVHECLLRNGLVECGVKNNDLRHVRQDLAASPQSQCMTVVMYRSQFAEFVDLFDDLIGNQSGLGEHFCTLYYTVTNCGNFVHAGDHSTLAGSQCVYQTGKCFCMCREIAVLFHLYAGSGLVAQVTIDTDTVAVALCDDRLIFHIDELILQ